MSPSGPELARLPLVLLAAAAGGAVNAIAGGGTLLTFPALLGLGVPAIVANATSTVALWPGTVSSIWGYREVLGGARPWATRFAIPSLLGGLAGALLLLHTPAERFDALVPWLVLAATTLFIVQQPVMGHLRRRKAASGAGAPPPIGARDRDGLPTAGVLLAQFGIAVYGGYFGAGIGILMLAALGFMGLADIHRMNGLKNWGAACINGVAAITFALSGLVSWPIAATMAVGSIIGGYGGSRLAQRVPQARVRQTIIGIGLASGVWLLVQRL